MPRLDPSNVWHLLNPLFGGLAWLEPQVQGIVPWELDWHLQVEPPLNQEPMRAIQQLVSGSVWPEAMGARALAVR